MSCHLSTRPRVARAVQQTGLPNAFDVTWHGAVVTFDGMTPIYAEDQGTRTGMWIVAEYPPSLT